MKRYYLLFFIFLATYTFGQNEVNIKVNSSNINSYRNELLTKIYGQTTLPTYQASTITTNVSSIDYIPTFPYASLYYPSGNLSQIDKYVIDLDYGCSDINVYIFKPQTSNGKLFIYHSGHNMEVAPKEDIDVNNIGASPGKVIPYLIDKGYTVMAVPMPCNASTFQHNNLFSNYGASFYEVFFKGTLASLNTIGRNNFTDIYMMGLSGGGWTTSIYPSIDTSIKYSFPISGSYPRQLWPNSNGDIEQKVEIVFPNFLNYEDFYVLNSVGTGRKQVQINSRYDPCCFFGEDKYIYYVDNVKSRLSEMGYANQFAFYLDETHTMHKVSDRALEIINHSISHNEGVLTSLPTTAIVSSNTYSYDIKQNFSSLTSTVNSNNLTYSLLKSPSWLSINSSTGILSGTATSSSVDITDTILFKVEDNIGNFKMYTYQLTTSPPPPCVDFIFTKIFEDSGWSYYGENGTTNYAFAIEHTPAGGNSATFSANILFRNPNCVGYLDVFSIEHQNTKEAIYIGGNYWNLELTSGFTNGNINIRFFNNTHILSSIESMATTFQSINTVSYKAPLIHFAGTYELSFPSQIRPDAKGVYGNLTRLIVSSSGTYNGKDYTQFDGIDLNIVKGGAILQLVTNRNENPNTSLLQGTIRYNSITHKFQGWNGSTWVNFN